MQVKGTVQKIRFHNEENGWTVLLLSTEDGDLTCVGTFLSISEGESWQMEGSLVFHDRYGEQLQVSRARQVQPEGREELLRYLSSDLVPFIGPKTAEKLLDRYGEEVLSRIMEDVSTLTAIRGIGKKKARAIQEAIASQQEARQEILYLQSLEIGPKTAAAIYRAYGAETRKILEDNPYRMMEEVDGVGFQTADRIAQKAGIAPDSLFRLRAALLYLFRRGAYEEGICFFTEEELTHRLRQLLSTSLSQLPQLLFELEGDGQLVVDREKGRIYLEEMDRLEKTIARRLYEVEEEGRKEVPLSLPPDFFDRREGFQLSPKQQEAVRLAAKTPCLVITGGPGTGKTTILKTILRLLEENGRKTLLAAPTGRAAKRMEESTGREAQTLHRLLGYRSGEGLGFQAEHTQDNPIDAQALIVDEASMMDLFLMGATLEALPLGCRLLFVGDVDQLPPVGPGNVLQDLLKSGRVPSISLDQIFRQQSESLIVVNAHRINRGLPPLLNERSSDFFFLPATNSPDCADLLTDLVLRRLPDHYGLDPLRDIQVLSVTKKGPCGVEELNRRLQQALNPPSEEEEEWNFGDRSFRRGDKVMQMKNDYKLRWTRRQGEEEEEGEGVYNGDFGFIQSLDGEEDRLLTAFDDRLVVYNHESLRELDHAYAITVHKSQGSEFPCIVLPLVASSPLLLTRNILYTAITRARKLVVLVGSQRVLEQMVERRMLLRRSSSLDERIRLQWKVRALLEGREAFHDSMEESEG